MHCAPAFFYGAHCTVVADTHLLGSRRAMAAAISTSTGGKGLDRVFMLEDAGNSGIDPAVDAHVLPLQFLALAWWESWIPTQKLKDETRGAIRKLARVNAAVWTGVNGPVTAAVATAHRLKWRFTSHCALQTDDGRELVLTRDPPAVVVKHVKLAVRRWRLARVIHDLPALLPPLPIRTNAWQPLSRRLLPDAVLLDESVLAQLMCGRGVPRDVKKIWSKDARAWFRSTAIGVQWL